MGYSAKTIVQTAIDTINEKYGKVWYRRYNRFQNDGYDYNVGKYHDGIWSFDCLGFVHTMVNGFKGITSLLGGGALMDDFVNRSNESVTLTKYCSVRGQFPKKNIKPASLLMMSGHVGLFVGERTENGQIINSAEVTCAMGAGGKFSWVDVNTGKRYSCKGGDYLGMWTNWGEFDRVDYDYNDQEVVVAPTNNNTVVDKNKIYGVDLCYHQGDIDFKKLKNAGIQFIIPRDGWGVNCDGQEIDKKFLTNVSEALKVGIKVPAVYHFIYAVNVNEAIENAKCAIRNVEKAGLPKSTIIWCDQEEDTVVTAKKQGYNVTTKMQTEITKAFCDYCLEQGYCTGVYLNQDYIKRVYGQEIINQYDIWLVDLEGEAYCKCLYRQINWHGKVDGVSGYIDIDEYYGQYTAGTAKPKSTNNTQNNTSNNTNTNQSNNVNTMALALEILDGKWGNNPNRKNDITNKYGAKAYQEAQAYVDKIVKYKTYTTVAVEILNKKWGNNPQRKTNITATYNATTYTVAQNYVNAGFNATDISNGYKVAIEILRGNWGTNPTRKNNITKKYNANTYTIAQDIVNHIYND